MGIDFANLGFVGWLLLIGGLVAALIVEAFICAAFGLAAAAIKGPGRLVLWPIGFLVGLAMLPGLLFGALLFGFMTPPFSAHRADPKDQSWPQRGLNGIFELVTKPAG